MGADPDKDIAGWAENDRGVSFIFGTELLRRIRQRRSNDDYRRHTDVQLQGSQTSEGQKMILKMQWETSSWQNVLVRHRIIVCRFWLIPSYAVTSQRCVYPLFRLGEPI